MQDQKWLPEIPSVLQWDRSDSATIAGWVGRVICPLTCLWLSLWHKRPFPETLGVKIFQFAAALQLSVSLISTLMSPAVAPLMLFIVFVPWALVVLKALLLVYKKGKSSSYTFSDISFSDISFSLECVPGSSCHTWAAWIYPILLSVPWFAPANWAILGLILVI